MTALVVVLIRTHFRPILANVAVQYICIFTSVDVTVAKQSLLARVGC